MFLPSTSLSTRTQSLNFPQLCTPAQKWVIVLAVNVSGSTFVYNKVLCHRYKVAQVNVGYHTDTIPSLINLHGGSSVFVTANVVERKLTHCQLSGSAFGAERHRPDKIFTARVFFVRSNFAIR